VRIAQKKFTAWMAAWGTYNGWEVGEYKDPVGNRCTYYIGEELPKQETKECPF